MNVVQRKKYNDTLPLLLSQVARNINMGVVLTAKGTVRIEHWGADQLNEGNHPVFFDREYEFPLVDPTDSDLAWVDDLVRVLNYLDALESKGSQKARLREAALAKLTKEEKEALGLA